MKRTRRSGRIEREAMERLTDRLSDLPDCVLLHIMNFMNIKDAIQTCLLSKRWKDLWKRLTNLTLCCSEFRRLSSFNKFVSSFLSCRDDSTSLTNLDLSRSGCIEPELLNRVMRYAASHDVQQLMISDSSNLKKDFELPSCLFYCRSLTFLKLSFWFPNTLDNKIKLTKSLELPALKSLYLGHVTFATSDNGCAEPVSTCTMLHTLVIEQCYLQSDAEVLCISNSNLFSLTIITCRHYRAKPYQIMLSTPNLNLLTMEGDLVYQLSSTCNITCLEEVNIDVIFGDVNYSVLISLLQVLVNVKIMTLSWYIFALLNDLLSHDSNRTQLPCFVGLKSLKLKRYSYPYKSDEVLNKMAEYLLQNSPLTGVDIIKC